MFIATGYVGAAPATIVYTDSDRSNSNGTSYSFSGLSIGTAAADRVVFVWVNTAFLSTGSISSVKLGGNNCTLRFDTSGADDEGLYSISVPTGTSATVQINTSSGTMFGAAVAVWAAYGLRSASPVDTYNGGFSSSPNSGSVTVPGGGIVMGNTEGPTNGNYSWSGLTENAELSWDPGNDADSSFASGSFRPPQSPLSVSVSYGGSFRLRLASFR